MGGRLQMGCELGEQCLALAQRLQDPARLLQAHYVVGLTWFHFGQFVPAREHLEQGLALYGPRQRHAHRLQAPEVACLSYAALVLWNLGYPDQALKRSQEALTLAQELSHPFSLAFALNWAVWFHQYRREEQLTQERAEAVMDLSREQGFALFLATGTIQHGWALTEQRQVEEGLVQIYQGVAAYRATGTELAMPYHLALLAEACGKVGQTEEGLSALTEALDMVEKTGERVYEAELYRPKGELLLAQAREQ